MTYEVPERKSVVVVIEDNPAELFLYQLALNEANVNCELTSIQDGYEALAFVHQEGEFASHPVPDLIVLDMHLPGVGGIEILQALENTPMMARVAIAVLSSGLSPREEIEIQQFPMAQYSSKPTGLDEVLSMGVRLKGLLIEARAMSRENVLSARAAGR